MCCLFIMVDVVWMECAVYWSGGEGLWKRSDVMGDEWWVMDEGRTDE